MGLVLGIDTGGTFTDSVIYDLASQKVLAKAKAPTTYDDLTRGIRESINSLTFQRFKEIKLVSLSTTMATNAIVEGRGSEVGLILIGEEPVGPLPVQHYGIVCGGHDIKGFPREDLDLSKIEEVLEGFRGKVKAIAVSGFASVRNPEHELKVKELAVQKTNLPVVCGHELTTSLGFHERTVTAVLNAKLIPIITDLIASVKKALAEKEIYTPLMIVKGDGTLMAEPLALEKPIETILSGPAASIIGATVLTDSPQALVVDMGGTTTDIAMVKGGVPRINPEGATVGGWLTRVEAADVFTYGLGGDSQLLINKDGQLLIGPQKVWPLSYVGSKYDYILDELELQRRSRNRLRPSAAADSFILLRKYDSDLLNETEKKVLEILAEGPHTLFYLAKALDKNPFSFDLDRLIKIGVVAKSAVTPTDILHGMAVLTHWNKETAVLGIKILAEQMGKSDEDFITLAFDTVIENLCLAILQSVLTIEGAPSTLTDNLKANFLVNKLLNSDAGEILNAAVQLSLPIVGIGAPVEAYLPKVAERLNSRLIIPQYSDVANAIGAAAGKIMEKIKITICSTTEGYFLYSQWERKNFAELDTAKAYALELAEKKARIIAEKAGTENYEIVSNCHDRYSNAGSGSHLETTIEVNILGRPKW